MVRLSLPWRALQFKKKYPTDKSVRNTTKRTPRSLEYMSFFKASEYRVWMLFYSLPVLALYLPADYCHHLAILVYSMHVLLSDAIPRKDIECIHHNYGNDIPWHCRWIIFTFYIHIKYSAYCGLSKLWGLLWVNSMAGFESFNGFLNKSFMVQQPNDLSTATEAVITAID